MADKRHTLAVFIGRFQPFHHGHRTIVEDAATRADSILMLVGSSYRPRSWKNPLLFEERAAFIREGVEDIRTDIDILPIIDTLYNDRAWAANVRLAVNTACRARGLDPEQTDVLITGFDKDKSSNYLSWFPEWRAHPVEPATHDGQIINATDFREAVFGQNLHNTHEADLAEIFGKTAVRQIARWQHANPEAFDTVAREGEFVRAYKERTARAEAVFGYPIPINTADAVVVQSGHVLVVERGVEPGIGTLALPGGHIDRNETALDAALRECQEETRLDIPKGALRGRLRNREVFDHPERSERGWVRTEAFHFELVDRRTLETVKGGDDARKAFWKPLSEITPEQMFEDHFDILQSFVPEVFTSYTTILMVHDGALGKTTDPT